MVIIPYNSAFILDTGNKSIRFYNELPLIWSDGEIEQATVQDFKNHPEFKMHRDSVFRTDYGKWDGTFDLAMRR